MSRVHSLRFDLLESRKLLTTAHVVAAHAKPAKVVVPSVPVVLSGTLAIDNNATVTNENADGTYTTSVPVAGALGGLGEVHGVWNETVDQYGDVDGLDALRLHNASGTLIVGFNNEVPGKPRPAGHGNVYIEDAQSIYSGTGAYAHAKETGSIQIVSNSAQTIVKDLTLHTRGT